MLQSGQQVILIQEAYYQQESYDGDGILIPTHGSNKFFYFTHITRRHISVAAKLRINDRISKQYGHIAIRAIWPYVKL
jgi:hypothetical protein